MFRRKDVLASLVIGSFAGVLMYLVGRVLALPFGIRSLLPLLPFGFPAFTFAVMLTGAIAGMRFPFTYQLAKFLLVGGLNFLIDLGVLNLLISFSGITEGFAASVWKALAFLVAMVSSFFWNKFWTFDSRDASQPVRQFAEFFVVTVIGFAVNVGTFALVNDWVGPAAGIEPQTWASISALAAAVVGLASNFLGYKFVVFRR